MRLLLDPQVFLWYVTADPRLPQTFHTAIQNYENDVYLSAASIWEAVIKHGLGKLAFSDPPAEYLPRLRERHRISSLAIDEAVMVFLAKLPALHRDPFDRILIAQSLQHDLTFLTVDNAAKAYQVKLLPS